MYSARGPNPSIARSQGCRAVPRRRRSHRALLHRRPHALADGGDELLNHRHVSEAEWPIAHRVQQSLEQAQRRRVVPLGGLPAPVHLAHGGALALAHCVVVHDAFRHALLGGEGRHRGRLEPLGALQALVESLAQPLHVRIHLEGHGLRNVPAQAPNAALEYRQCLDVQRQGLCRAGGWGRPVTGLHARLRKLHHEMRAAHKRFHLDDGARLIKRTRRAQCHHRGGGRWAHKRRRRTIHRRSSRSCKCRKGWTRRRRHVLCATAHRPRKSAAPDELCQPSKRRAGRALATSGRLHDRRGRGRGSGARALRRRRIEHVGKRVDLDIVLVDEHVLRVVDAPTREARGAGLAGTDGPTSHRDSSSRRRHGGRCRRRRRGCSRSDALRWREARRAHVAERVRLWDWETSAGRHEAATQTQRALHRRCRRRRSRDARGTIGRRRNGRIARMARPQRLRVRRRMAQHGVELRQPLREHAKRTGRRRIERAHRLRQRGARVPNRKRERAVRSRVERLTERAAGGAEGTFGDTGGCGRATALNAHRCDAARDGRVGRTRGKRRHIARTRPLVAEPLSRDGNHRRGSKLPFGRCARRRRRRCGR
eukprot:Opistho-1_new@30074